MLIFRVFTDAGCVVGFAIRRFRTKALNHSVIHTLRFPVLRTIGDGDGALLPRGYRCAKPSVIIVAALSHASHDWRWRWFQNAVRHNKQLNRRILVFTLNLILP